MCEHYGCSTMVSPTLAGEKIFSEEKNHTMGTVYEAGCIDLSEY